MQIHSKPLHWAGMKALRNALLATIEALQVELLHCDFGSEKTSVQHLRWMCEEMINQIDVMPIDKTGRWIGFVQGVMAANGCLNVDAERARTRPLFQRAYALLADFRDRDNNPTT